MYFHSRSRAMLVALAISAGCLGGAWTDSPAQCPPGPAPPPCITILEIQSPGACVEAGSLASVRVTAVNCSPETGNMTLLVGGEMRLVENVAQGGVETFEALVPIPADCAGGSSTVPVRVEIATLCGSAAATGEAVVACCTAPAPPPPCPPTAPPPCITILEVQSPQACVEAGGSASVRVTAVNCSPETGNMTLLVGGQSRLVENVAQGGVETFEALVPIPADCAGGSSTVPVRVEIVTPCGSAAATGEAVVSCCAVSVPQCLNVLVLDEETIDGDISTIESAASQCAGGMTPEQLINADRPTQNGNRALRWNELCPGTTVTLPGGLLHDEGLFALPSPPPWSLEAFVAGSVRNNDLVNVQGVRPLGTAELPQLVGQSFVGIVYHGDITVKKGKGRPGTAHLHRERLGAFYFTVLGVVQPGTLPESTSPSSLSDLVVRVDPVPGSDRCVQQPELDFYDRSWHLHTHAYHELYSPSPNPFRTQTQFAFQVDGSAEQNVEIGVYDVAGRQVRKLVSGVHTPGRYTARWDGRDEGGMPVQTGVYFLRAAVGEQELSKSRVMYLR